MICDWWISIRFVCFCVSGFVACDRNYDWRQRKTQLWRRLMNFRVRIFVKSAVNTSNTAQSLCKPFPRNQLATKAQSFPRKSTNTAFPMIARHAQDFTCNRGCSSNSPPLKHGDQISQPLEDSDNQIPSSPGRQTCQMPGVFPGGACWSFDLTDTLRDCDIELPNFTRPRYAVGQHSTKSFFFFV